MASNKNCSNFWILLSKVDQLIKGLQFDTDKQK